MIDSLWNKNETFRLSADTSVILRPSISKSSYAESFTGPRVSMAIERNVYVVESSEYLRHFLVDASSATSLRPRVAAAT